MGWNMNKAGMAGIALALAVSGCGENDAPAPSAVAEAPSVAFVTTQDGSPLTIAASLLDTPEALEFARTGNNPYRGNAAAMEQGRKLFQLYSCTQCHGGDAQGQTGPGLRGPDFRYAKNAGDQGMFETIWHGTNGGMGAKGRGLMDPDNPDNGLSPDEVLKIIAWVRGPGAGTRAAAS